MKPWIQCARRNAGQLVLIVNGRAGRAAVSVVPEALRCAAGVPDTGLAAGSYCMAASFMLFWRHGWDIHAVLVRCWSGERDESAASKPYQRPGGQVSHVTAVR